MQSAIAATNPGNLNTQIIITKIRMSPTIPALSDVERASLPSVAPTI